MIAPESKLKTRPLDIRKSEIYLPRPEGVQTSKD